MIQALEKESEDQKKKILTTTSAVNSGILLEEGTDSKQALERLNEIEAKQINVYNKKD